MNDTQSKIQQLNAEIADLHRQIQEKKNTIKTLGQSDKLTNSEIARYSRQIILPNFGIAGQLKLKRANVLIVGAGGLGCPSALHLAGCGVGHLGIVDYDDVEVNNLHRQLLHTESGIGASKVDSVKAALHKLNSGVKVSTYKVQLDSKNALEIIGEYDLVLDCTDNVATRYLLNDACVMKKKPLVSGSALQYEGQLTVYNHEEGPCYRCVFPKPPPPESVTNCGDGGVLAPVTGVIGTLQSMEAIKILQGHPCLSGRLLLYDALDCTFRNVKLRSKKSDCEVCGATPSITALIDYEQFCGMKATDKDSHLNILQPDQRITVQQYQRMSKESHLLIDVRSSNEYEICRLENSVNLPIKDVLDERKTADLEKVVRGTADRPLVFLCRRGNDSQLAVERAKKLMPDIEIYDIVGGLHAWTQNVDPNFPIY